MKTLLEFGYKKAYETAELLQSKICKPQFYITSECHNSATKLSVTISQSKFSKPADATREVALSNATLITAGGILLALFCVVFFDFFRRQILFAWTQPSDWGHTLLIPLISGYFIWLRRSELSQLQPFKQCWWGLMPITLGVGWYMVCVFGPKPLFHHNIMSVGIALSLFGTAWLLFGTIAMRWLWFPIAFTCVFAQTLSEVLLNKVTFQMQDIAAYGAHFLLTVIGTEVDRNGNTLTVWSDGIAHPLNVAEACSGMRMLVAFLALGVFLAYTNLKGWWQRSLLVLCGVPIAILVNMIRIASMGILTQYDQNFVDGEFHELVGVLWMLPALFFYMGTLWVVRNLIVDETEVKHAV